MEDLDQVYFKHTHGIVEGCLGGKGIGRLNKQKKHTNKVEWDSMGHASVDWTDLEIYTLLNATPSADFASCEWRIK